MTFLADITQLIVNYYSAISTQLIIHIMQLRRYFRVILSPKHGRFPASPTDLLERRRSIHQLVDLIYRQPLDPEQVFVRTCRRRIDPTFDARALRTQKKPFTSQR